MADNLLIKILIEAQDKATAILQKTAGEAKGVAAASNEMEGALGAAGSTIVTGGLVAVGAAITAIALASVKAAANLREMATQAQALSNLSASSGVAASHLQSMKNGIEDLGLPAESLGTSLKFLERAIADNNPVLDQLGIKSRDTYGALLELSDLFERTADGPNKTRIALELLGSRGGAALIPFLDQGSAKLEEMEKHLNAIGLGLTDAQIARLTRLSQASKEAGDAWGGLRTQFSLDFLRPVELITKALGDLAGALQNVLKWRDNVDRIFYGKSAPTSGAAMGPTWLGPEKPQAPSIQTGSGPQGPSLDEFARRIASWFGTSGGAQGLGASSLAHDSPAMRLKELADALAAVDVPATKFTQQIELMKLASDDAHNALTNLRVVGVASFVDGIQQMVHSVISGKTSIIAAFAAMMQGILAKIAESAAQLGIGIGLEALGGYFGGPVGLFIGAVGKGLDGHHSASGYSPGSASMRPAGGGGYGSVYISALDSKSVLDAYMSPTGSLRQAEVRRAQTFSFSGA